MMNKETRKLSRFPNEVRAEIGHYLVDSPPVLDEDGKKIPELDDNTADYVQTGLTVSQRLLNYESHYSLSFYHDSVTLSLIILLFLWCILQICSHDGVIWM